MTDKDAFDLSAAIAAVKCTLSIPAPFPGQPALVMLCGLPGTGKTTLARRLAECLPAVTVEADRIRHTLFRPPTYAAEESRRVHMLCHFLMGWYLRHADRQGRVWRRHVIYDATNLYEYYRTIVCQLAERQGARLVVVEVIARDDVVRGRLEPRHRQEAPALERGDCSDADWEVYLRMRGRAEPIGRDHLTFDTTDGALDQAVEAVLAAARAPTLAVDL